MNKPLTLGSLFDGSGTFPMMGMLSGIVPKWSSEIEPFPIAVTTKRCYLLRLGMIGAEYKAVRKVLLRNLSGSSAFRKAGKENEVSE